MLVSNVLDAILKIGVTMLDMLAWPATHALQNGPTETAVQFAIAFAVTAASWLLAATLLSLGLRTVTAWIRFTLLEIMVQAGGAKTMRRSTRTIYAFCQGATRIRVALGIRYYQAGEEKSDSFRRLPTLGHFSTGLARSVQVITLVPHIVYSFIVGFFLNTKTWWYLLILTGITSWAVWRPDSTFWKPLMTVLVEFTKANTGTVLVAWIPGIAVLVALFSSAKWRGRLSWRIRRFEDAHETLDALSDQAQKSASALHRMIDESSHFLTTTALREVTSALTADHCYWHDTEGLVWAPATRNRLRPSRSGPGDRVWSWGQNQAVKSALEEVHTHLNSLAETYQDLCRSKRLESDLHNIATMASRVVLFALWRPRASSENPWHGELRNVDIAVYEKEADKWLKQHKNTRNRFHNLTDKANPDAALIVEANLAVMQLARNFRSKLAKAMWFEEELESLVRAGQDIRFPSFFKRIRERASQ